MKPIKRLLKSSDSMEYHPYDTNLPIVFAELRRLLQEELPTLQIEHVGSSSIPGVGGRNAIDIVILAAEANQADIKQHLYDLGFEDSPFRHFLPLLVGAIVFQNNDYPILLYVLSPDSDVYRGWITFRDYLRAHPEDAQEYNTLKQQIIAAGNIEGRHYQQAKTPFLISMMAKIQRNTNPEQQTR